MRYVQALILIALLCVSILSGCTLPANDTQVLADFAKLEKKYGVTDGYLSNTGVMDGYLDELALLRSKASGNAAQVLDAELSSAKTFVALNKTVAKGASINYQNFSCNTPEVKTTIALAKTATAYATNAVQLVTKLSDTQRATLRPTQLEMVQGYETSLKNMQAYFTKKC